MLSRLERVKAKAGRVVVAAWMPRSVYTLESELDIYEVIARLETEVQFPFSLTYPQNADAAEVSRM